MTVERPTERAAPIKRQVITRGWQPDEGLGDIRIGLIELATAEAGERDLRTLVPANAAVLTSRVLNENPVSVANLRAQLERLRLATEQLVPGAPLDVVIYNCTSGTVAMGFDAIAKEIREVRPGIAVVTPMTAALAAFQALEAKRVSVLAPYSPDITDVILDYLLNNGIEVDAAVDFGLASDLDMALLPPDVIAREAIATFEGGADALFIPCTAIRAVDVIEEVEQELGVPVVTSIQAAAWQALRVVGWRGSLGVGGSLMGRTLR